MSSLKQLFTLTPTQVQSGGTIVAFIKVLYYNTNNIVVVMATETNFDCCSDNKGKDYLL